MKRKNIRKYNKQLLLREIYSQKTSRAEIAKKFSIRPATVTEIIQELIIENKIIETGSLSNKKKGRNRVGLAINPDYGNIIGIYIDDYNVYGVLINFAGDIEKSIKIINEKPLRNIISTNVNSVVSNLIEGVPTANVHAIGIASVGVIDEEFGICITTSRIKGFDNINLKKIVKNVPLPKGIKVNVCMAVKARILAEKWFGISVNNNFVVYLQIEAGIAISVINKGIIYMSSNPTAGLFGHTIIDENIIKNTNFYAKEGQLETFLNADRIIEECNKALNIDTENYLSLDEIVLRVKEGDSAIINTIRKFIKYIAIAVANVYNTYGPDKIILGGLICDFSDIILPETKILVKKMLLFPPSNDDFIEVSKMDVFAGSVGATVPFFEEFYSIPEPRGNE